MKVELICFIILVQIFFSNCNKPKTFDELLEDLKKDIKTRKMAVAGADNPETLKTAIEAKNMKIGDSILIGNEERIKGRAKENNLDISGFEIVNIDDPIEICRYSVKIVHDGKADMLVKGSVETRDLLKAILDNEIGLKSKELMNLVGVFEMDGKLTFLTDISVIPYPSLDVKIQLINNAVKLARSVGIEVPKVAAIAGLSVSNTRMPETMEAEKLTEMNIKGEIKDCIVDGPLSLDLAISSESAQIKYVHRRVNGDADILLFPDVHAANISYKILTHLSDSKNGNILLGTTKPVISTSRSDSVQTKINSIILGFWFDRFNSQNN